MWSLVLQEVNYTLLFIVDTVVNVEIMIHAFFQMSLKKRNCSLMMPLATTQTWWTMNLQSMKKSGNSSGRAIILTDLQYVDSWKVLHAVEYLKYLQLIGQQFSTWMFVYRQISVISADGENARCRSVKRHACSQRKHADMQEKKPQEMEKLIQAETTETGRVSV